MEISSRTTPKFASSAMVQNQCLGGLRALEWFHVKDFKIFVAVNGKSILGFMSFKVAQIPDHALAVAHGL